MRLVDTCEWRGCQVGGFGWGNPPGCFCTDVILRWLQMRIKPALAIHFVLGRNGDSNQEQISVQSATQIIADGIEESLPLRASVRDGVA